jgi:hypothetical protein
VQEPWSEDVAHVEPIDRNHCCSGKKGTIDNSSGKITLKNAALNPLERHLKKAHGP